MKVTFPHMGNIYIPLKTFFEKLDVEVVVPPLCNRRTLELGIANSPEFACLPLKINVGNYIEAIEQGADTIVMAGGIGPCRFGYYAEVQREILSDLGYEFKMVVLEPPQGHLFELLKELRIITNSKRPKDVIDAAKFAWQKAVMLDDLERKVFEFRPIEKYKGEVDKIYNKALHSIEKADDEKDLNTVKARINRELNNVKIDDSKTTPKIAIVGEIYTILEPFANLYIEKQLGELGVHVNRNIYVTDWVKENLFPSFLKPQGHKKMLEFAKPYINCFIGGHGQESVAQVVNFSKQGYDGVIHLLPFTCMPEIVAKSVLPSVSKHYSIPVMTLVLDELSGEAGIRTRLEAFVDMIIQKKEEANDTDEMFYGNRCWVGEH